MRQANEIYGIGYEIHHEDGGVDSMNILTLMEPPDAIETLQKQYSTAKIVLNAWNKYHFLPPH